MCSTATRISGVGEGKGEEEQRGKRGIHKKCYCSSYNVEYGNLIVAYSMFKHIISLFKLDFFCGGVYPHWYNFQLFLIIVEKCSEISFFASPLVCYSRSICNIWLRLFHSFVD